MADLGQMVVRILGDISDFDKKLGAAEGKMKDTAKNIQAIGTKMTLAVSVPLVGIAAAATKAAMNMEDAEAAFTTMLGSATKAKSLLEDMRKFAAATPFQLSDLTSASKTLLQFGVDANRVMPTLKAIGDVSGGNAQRFQSLSLAFGQARSAGRLMGQDLLQMINAGFNPLQEISRATGQSMVELKKQMEDGAISADMVAESFERASSEGGQFFEGMERGSKTLSGQLSTLMDELAALGREFGEVFLPIAKNAVRGLTDMVKNFQGLDDGTKRVIITVGAVAAAIGPLILLVSGLAKGVVALQGAMALLAANPIALALAATAAALIGVKVAMDAITSIGMTSRLKETEERFKNVAAAAGLSAKKIAEVEDAFSRVKPGEISTASIESYAKYAGLSVEQVLGIARASERLTAPMRQAVQAVERQFEVRKQQEATEAELVKSSAKIKDSRQRIAEEEERIKLSSDKSVVNSIRLYELDKARLDLAEQYRVAFTSGNETAKRAALDRIKAIDAEVAAIKSASDAVKPAGLTAEDQKRAQAMREQLQLEFMLTNSTADRIKAIESERKAKLETAAAAKVLNGAEIDALNDHYDALIRVISAENELQDVQDDGIETSREIAATKEELAQEEADRIANMTLAQAQAEQKALRASKTYYQVVSEASEDFMETDAANDAEMLRSEQNALRGMDSASKRYYQNVTGDAESAAKARKAAEQSTFDFVVSKAAQAAQTLMSLSQTVTQNQVAQVNAQLDASLKANERALQARLELEGLDTESERKRSREEEKKADQDAIKSAQDKLAAAMKANDAEAISEAQLTLTKAQEAEARNTAEYDRETKRMAIIKEFQQKEEALKREAAQKTYGLQLAAFETKKAFDTAAATISTAAMAIEAFKSVVPILGPIGGGIAAAAALGLGAAQIANIQSQQPPPPPSFAEGGIVMPRAGGVMANVAEAGQPEVIFPLDKLERFLSSGSTGSGGVVDGGDIHLVVNLDSKPFLDKIFPATRNRQILISAGAVI